MSALFTNPSLLYGHQLSLLDLILRPCLLVPPLSTPVFDGSVIQHGSNIQLLIRSLLASCITNITVEWTILYRSRRNVD